VEAPVSAYSTEYIVSHLDGLFTADRNQKLIQLHEQLIMEISSSHSGGEYEAQNLLG
jgi:hypothetical protein